MPESVSTELKQYQILQQDNKSHVDSDWIESEYDFVFCGLYGQALYYTSPTMWWNRFIKRNNLRKIRLHDIRHTHVTMAISAKHHDATITKRMGWSTSRMIDMDI
ncbi:hypothetical protein [Chengkuizengella sediminis]|uniref:hypothetical protein n=1 Tax=Chengkuizengella sediminis TaxID=1885917 RepID=UPI003B82D46B